MPLTVKKSNLQELIQKSGKVLSNVASNVINPAYNLTTTILIGLYHLSLSATTLPIVGGVFALISISLASITTFADKRRTVTEKFVFLGAMVVAGALAGLALAFWGTKGALIIGLVGATTMTVLQTLDLFGKIKTYRKRKESLKSKEQLLNALNNENCHDLPLTKDMHKWAIIYSKMVTLEKNFPGLAETDKKHYENLDKQLDIYLKRFRSESITPDDEKRFVKALTKNTLNSLDASKFKTFAFETYTELERAHAKNGITETEYAQKKALLENFIGSNFRAHYINYRNEIDTFFYALRTNKLTSLNNQENYYLIALKQYKKINDVRQDPKLSPTAKANFEKALDKLKIYITEVDFKESTKIFDYLTLHILGSDKEAKNNILKALKENDSSNLKCTEENYKWTTIFLKIVQREKNCSYLNQIEINRYDKLEAKLQSILQEFDNTPDLDFDKKEVLCDEDDLESLFKKRQDEYAKTISDSQEILSLNKKIARITTPFDRGDYKLKQGEIKIAYATCDLLLAFSGIALAILGLIVAFSPVAPAVIPTVIIGLGIGVAAITILRGGSKFCLDMFKKWGETQKNQDDIKNIDEYINNPSVQPKYSSDFAILRIFNTTAQPQIAASIPLSPQVQTVVSPPDNLALESKKAENQAPSLENSSGESKKEVVFKI